MSNRAEENAVQTPMTQETLAAASDAQTSPEPDQGNVAALAYSLWESRGCPLGSPEEDWFQAEEQLRTQHTKAAGA